MLYHVRCLNRTMVGVIPCQTSRQFFFLNLGTPFKVRAEIISEILSYVFSEDIFSFGIGQDIIR